MMGWVAGFGGPALTFPGGEPFRAGTPGGSTLVMCALHLLACFSWMTTRSSATY